MSALSRDSGIAFLLALGAFTILSLGDAIVKSIADEWPGTAIATVRYSIGAFTLAGIIFAHQGRRGFSCPHPWLQLARGASVTTAAVFFFLALFVMPLTEATVIQFINPMLVAVISGLFLKEQAPPAVWIATAIAFAGVLIVLRPEVAAVGWAGALPLAAALGMALTMILNRKLAGSASVLQMQFLLAACAVPFALLSTIAGHFSGIASLVVDWPTPSIILRCACVAVTATLAHGLLYMATLRASAAAIAPAVYVQLLVAMLLGYVFFDDRPDIFALGGASLIVGAGLYLWRSQTTVSFKDH
jgi:drug/metabolite transporter (DMT)-like permease